MTKASTGNCSAELEKLENELNLADAVVIGAGAGMSVSAGLNYDGARFERYFSDFHQKYGIMDMYSGGFYPYETLEEYWAWWSRHIACNRYDQPPGKPYTALQELLKGRNYFVLTTNVDHQFQLAGFDKQRLFYTQGDYGLWQCSRACHQKTYDNEAVVRKMVKEQKNLKIPTELIPRCPVCGAPMDMNLRCGDNFVEDDGWYDAASRYDAFIRRQSNSRVLFLELGVGPNTPVIIKYPFWRLTSENPQATYACVNVSEPGCPREIAERSILIQQDIGAVLTGLLEIGSSKQKITS